MESVAAWEKLHWNREGERSVSYSGACTLVEPAVRIGLSDGTFAWPPPEAVRLPNIWQDK